jgi:hypothetical protein
LLLFVFLLFLINKTMAMAAIEWLTSQQPENSQFSLSGNFRNEIRLPPSGRCWAGGEKSFCCSTSSPPWRGEQFNYTNFPSTLAERFYLPASSERPSDMFGWQNKILIASIESAEGKIEMKMSLVGGKIRLNRAQFRSRVSDVSSQLGGRRTPKKIRLHLYCIPNQDL